MASPFRTLWIFSQIADAVDVSKLVLLYVSFQERKLVSTALLLEWSTDTALVRKFVTWIGQECHRLSQKRNELAFQLSFELKLGGMRRRALQDASTSMRYSIFGVSSLLAR